MKKIISLGLVFACGITLFGACTNTKEKDNKISEQSKTIESLNKQNRDLESSLEKQESIKLKTGESIDLSGSIVIGEELPAGIYDITSSGGDFGISFKSKDGDWSDYKALSADKEDGTYTKKIKSYNLKEGYTLEIDGNAQFTKIK